MRRTNSSRVWMSLGTAVMLAGTSLAQPPRPGPDRERGGPRGGGPPGHRVLEVLDADGDRVISAEELQSAAEALLKLDANGDGELTVDELRPPRPERRAGGPRVGDREEAGRGPRDRGDRERGARERDVGERDERRPDGQRRERGEVGPEGWGPEERAEWRRPRFDGHHAPGDPERRPRDVRRGDFGPPAGPGGRPERFAGHSGPEESHGGRRGGDVERGPGPFRGPPMAWGRGRGGPPMAERMIERAFEFDADDNGQLSREEFAEFVEAMHRVRTESPRPPRPDRDASERPENRPSGDRHADESESATDRERPPRPTDD